MSFENMKAEKEIPYYEETKKRTFVEKIKKWKNTFLGMLAYSCPINKLRIYFHRWRGVKIGKNVYIGMRCSFDNLYPDYIYIENNASINSGSMILTHFNPMKQFAPIISARVAPVVIEKEAILAVRTIVLPGVTVKRCSIVAAGSVVDKDVPEYTLVRGNPAKIITEYKYVLTN